MQPSMNMSVETSQILQSSILDDAAGGITNHHNKGGEPTHTSLSLSFLGLCE
jgi:hypothetical protein